MTSATSRIKICHLSDLHLPLHVGFSPSWLFSKRFFGWANISFSRSRTHKLEPLLALLEAVAKEQADAVIVTGDLTNLALDEEYARINRLFEEAGLDPKSTVLIPGNHDRYTPKATIISAFERGMSRWMPAGFRLEAGYPIRHDLGPVEIIGLDTAIWRGPFRAAGIVRSDQIERLVATLADCARRSVWPIIAMHHSPFPLSGGLFKDYRAGLTGRERLVSALDGHRGTILHGHMHVRTRAFLRGFEVHGVPSASNDVPDEDKRFAYAVHEFDEHGPRGVTVVGAVPTDRGGINFRRMSNAPMIDDNNMSGGTP